MTSGIAVKSESWLDLSQISQMAAEQRNQRQLVKRQSSVPSSGRRSSSSLVDQRQNSIPSVHLTGGQKNEHLLIRLRQRSYLNRSNSTTLSSNLSNSIDLNHELCVGDGTASEGPEEVQDIEAAQQQQHQHQQHHHHHLRRDLSFGLRSFRSRFERRFQQRAMGRNERATARERSPLARSWSSLSEQFSSRMNHIGHSWKNFIYNYKSNQLKSSNDFQGPDNDRGLSMRQNDRLVSQRVAGLETDEAELNHIRRRLTADWISRHSNLVNGPLVSAPPQPPLTKRQVDYERVQMRRRLRNQEDKISSSACSPSSSSSSSRRSAREVSKPAIRPRSIQLPCSEFVSEFKKLSAFDEEQDDDDDSDQEAYLAELDRRLARSQSHQPQDCPIERKRIVAQSSSSSTTNTSATLVSESQLISSKRQATDLEACRQQRAQTCSPSRQFKRRLHHLECDESNSNSGKQKFNLTATTTPLTSNSIEQTRQLLSPQVATSDYWSSSALTTASATSGRITEPVSMRRQHQQQHQQRPQSQQRLSDDYYLDVAAAAQFKQHQVEMNLMKQQDLVLFAPTADQQQQMQANYQQWASQQQLGFVPTQSVFQSSDGLDADYDDYAVPADESCCRLERSQVELVQLIGEGQKGYVFLGKLQSRNGQQIIDVAIKTLKYETEELIERLMSEAAMMKQLEHPHIIKFIGMCPETPALIAMELAKFGELKQYLKLNRNSIKISQLVLFSFQISTALSYLESKNYVHRDVAARNVLVCSHACVKLADFGLSRNLQPSLQQLQLLQTAPDEPKQGSLSPDDTQQLYVAAPRVKLPVRWLAPESLVFRRFTSASDVWMFAVCTWELFQFGLLRPWPQLRNNQVLLAIESGQRLARPELCPQRLYQLLLKCWSYAPVQRPKFREIKQSIWSIYLSERTREQLELEQFEREQQRYQLINAKPQPQQQQQIPILTSQLKQQQQQRLASQSPLVPSSGGGQFVIGSRSAAGLDASRSAGANYAASNYSSNTMTTTTTTTTTDNDDRSTSPGSSAFSSMARNQRATPTGRRQVDSTGPIFSPDTAHEAALRLQLGRFQQRQPLADANFRQAHMLQKQRSQGAIGLSTSKQYGEFDAIDRRASQKLSNCDRGDRKCQQRQQPVDDGALEYDGRRTKQRLYAMALKDIDCDDEADELTIGHEQELELERQQRVADHQRLLNTNVAIQQQQQQQQHLQKWRPESAFAPSVSPALTVDHTADNSRLASVEPSAVEQDVRLHECRLSPRAHPKLSNGNQVAMLRAKYDVSSAADFLARHPAASQSPVSYHRLSSVGPVLTPTQTPSRPTSWRSDERPQQQQRQQQENMMVNRNCQQVNQQPTRSQKPVDQLGQMLQALRITPMKAKLKSPPEQTVRVLQRQDDSPSPARQLIEQAQTASYANYQQQQQHEQAKPDQTSANSDKSKPTSNKLQLHQRLLGRIRSYNNQQQSSSPEMLVDGAIRGPKSGRMLQQKSVETVDQSLQLLESLIQNGERNQQAASASLPRRPKQQQRLPR